MSGTPSYYQTLGVSPTASDTEIKAAYRKLARQYHPDVNAGSAEAERKFKAVGEAYATLSDPHKRQAYDTKLGQTMKPKPPGGQSGSAKQTQPPPDAKPRASTPPKSEQPQKPQAQKQQTKEAPKASAKGKQPPPPDPTAKPSNQFKGMFDGLFRKEDRQSTEPKKQERPTEPPPPKKEAAQNKPKSSGPTPTRGEDVTVETFITAEEAERGTTKPVSVYHVEPCKRCSALGKVNGLICPACGGEKQQTQTRKLDVRIPGGVKTGSKIRVPKEGGYGTHGGEAGDLFLLIRVDNDKALRIEGAHVYSDILVTLPEAVLGCEVQVKTLQGSVTMNIPPLTAPGTVLRLKGKGLVLNPNTPVGDQFVMVQVTMPKALTAEERTHYEALLKLNTQKPREGR